MEFKKYKAIILFSGGLDSTTVLSMALEKYDKSEILALFMFYGQKHSVEAKSARNIASHYGIDIEFLNASFFFSLSDCTLLAGGKELEHTTYEEQTGANNNKPVSSYVPFRNGLFLSICAVVAYSVGAESIWYGANFSDSENGAYPDCSEKFIELMQRTIRTGTATNMKLVTPLARLSKAEVVAEGLKLNTPYWLTYSCYEGEKKPCHECASCRKREEAFVVNGTIDPLCEE